MTHATMSRRLRAIGSVLAALALASISAAAVATPVSSGANNPLNFAWSNSVTGFDGLQHTLTGNGSMTVSGFNSTLLSIVVTLNNTSPIGGVAGERLVSFAFGIDLNAAGIAFVDAADGGMVDAALGVAGTLGANVPGVEICVRGGNSCNGGGVGGIFGGASDSFTILLNGTWGNQVEIAPIGLKYETLYGDFDFPTGTSVTPPRQGNAPEPGSGALVLLSLAVLATGLGRRGRSLPTA